MHKRKLLFLHWNRGIDKDTEAMTEGFSPCAKKSFSMNRREQDAIFQEALALKKAKDYRGALGLIEQLQREGYDGLYFYTAATHLYFLVKDYQHALEMADAALRVSPGNQFARKLRASSLFYLDRKDEAAPIFYALASDDPDPHTAKAIADFLQKNGDARGALALLDRLLENAPGNRELMLAKAGILRASGDSGDAAGYYGEMVEKDPGDDFAYARYIEQKLKDLSPEESAEELQNILKIPSRKGNIHIRKLLARLLYGQKRYREAKEQYSEILKIDQGDWSSRMRLGFCLEHLEDYAGAIPFLEEAFTREPGNVYVRSALLKSYRNSGREEEGISFFQNILAGNPGMKQLWGVIKSLSKKGRQ